jgi:2-polyprenyl-3-methyl-5-hydroxy-6-metoxy-1,4-benzoquinol methylase
MAIFKNKEEFKKWIEENEWYQTMNLPSGLSIQGKVPTQLREPLFDSIDFKGKSFLDVGCNSGQYCFIAKDRGASEVVGIDFDGKRINQARIIAENENYDVRFEEKSIFDTGIEKKFDIVFCIAVITEIQDTFGAIEALKKFIGSYALIEISLAKPEVISGLFVHHFRFFRLFLVKSSN